MAIPRIQNPQATLFGYILAPTLPEESLHTFTLPTLWRHAKPSECPNGSIS